MTKRKYEWCKKCGLNHAINENNIELCYECWIKEKKKNDML